MNGGRAGPGGRSKGSRRAGGWRDSAGGRWRRATGQAAAVQGPPGLAQGRHGQVCPPSGERGPALHRIPTTVRRTPAPGAPARLWGVARMDTMALATPHLGLTVPTVPAAATNRPTPCSGSPRPPRGPVHRHSQLWLQGTFPLLLTYILFTHICLLQVASQETFHFFPTPVKTRFHALFMIYQFPEIPSTFGGELRGAWNDSPALPDFSMIFNNLLPTHFI